MSAAISVRDDFDADELRLLAGRVRDANQARRLLAIAAILDGMDREEAARIGGMDRQTLRDWVHRFNERGPDGLINIKPPGRRPRLSEQQKEALCELVEAGPDPLEHGVVRWRCVDLKHVLGARFGVDLSEVRLGQVLKELGFSHISARPRHTAIDYAHVLRDLSDTHFSDAVKIVLMQDNLNTHKPASLYEAFPAPEARRLVERFEWHYTPKHGSWLDMAESELGVLASQCLDRRIADKQILAHEVTAWQDHRNKHHAKADWQFTTANARVKLNRLYPQFE